MGSRKTYITETVSTTQDQRVAVEGGVGSLVAPGAAVGEVGAIAAAPGATVTQTISMKGLGGEDIERLMSDVFESTDESQRRMAGLAESAIEASSLAQAGLTDVVAAAKVPAIAEAQSMKPYIVLAVIALFVLWGFK